MDTVPATPKNQLRRLIEDQPDDSSFEEILKELAFAAMIEQGVAQAQAGRTRTQDEMRQIVASWRT